MPAPEHMITTTLSAGMCGRCGAKILHGYCGGERVRLDPTRINPTGEAIALSGGLATYEVEETGREGRRPIHRSGFHIRAGPPLRPTVTDHRCGHRWPPVCVDSRPDGAGKYEQPDECPF